MGVCAVENSMLFILHTATATVSGQACNLLNPIDLFLFPLVEEFYGTRYQSGSFS